MCMRAHMRSNARSRNRMNTKTLIRQRVSIVLLFTLFSKILDCTLFIVVCLIRCCCSCHFQNCEVARCTSMETRSNNFSSPHSHRYPDAAHSSRFKPPLVQTPPAFSITLKLKQWLSCRSPQRRRAGRRRGPIRAMRSCTCRRRISNASSPMMVLSGPLCSCARGCAEQGRARVEWLGRREEETLVRALTACDRGLRALCVCQVPR